MIVLRPSCEVIMKSWPTKLKKQTLHCNLIQQKLKLARKSTIKSNVFKLQRAVNYCETYRREQHTMVSFTLLYLSKAVSTRHSEALSLCHVFFSQIACLSSCDFFFFGERITGAGNASSYASIILLVLIPCGKGDSNRQACSSLL